MHGWKSAKYWAVFAAIIVVGCWTVPASANTSPPTPIFHYYGDSNGDLVIDASDLSQMKSYTLGLPYSYDTLQPQTINQAWNTSDVTSDTVIDAADISVLKSYTLGFLASIPDKPWVLQNLNLPLSGNPNNTWIPFNINLFSTVGTETYGRAGISVVAEIDPASPGHGQLKGRECAPIPGSRDQTTLPNAQCALAVTITDWTGTPGPKKGLTESEEYSLALWGYGDGDLKIKFHIESIAALDIPATSLSITIDFTDEITIGCPANINENASISCSVTTASGPGLCSVGPEDTCSGAIDSSCFGPYNAPIQGEAAGPGSCVASVTKGAAIDSNAITINEVNQNPSVTVDCPASVGENSAAICSLVASDADIPVQNLTCSLNGETTCTGVTLTGCTQANIPAQGESKGPGSCTVVVDVADNFAPHGSGQGSDTITIAEDNQTPLWITTPVNIYLRTNSSYSQNNGHATDNDLPKINPGDPGYLACEKTSQTCSFPITVSGSGAGAVDCNVSFTASSSVESCQLTVSVTDGLGAGTSTQNIQITVYSGILYVDKDAVGTNNGTSWADAFLTVGSALSVAQSGDQIWVAEGTYSSIEMKNGVEIYGGFVGTESSVAERGNPMAHPTILSGPATHVVYGASNARFDGFTITGGSAFSCTSWMDSSNCCGGGMFNCYDNLVVENCIFKYNRAKFFGGGIYNVGGSMQIRNCIFASNELGPNGMTGPMWGVGIFNGYAAAVEIINCTFTNNWGSMGGDVDGGALYNIDSAAIVKNSILWNDAADEISSYNGSISVTYSDVQGGYPGTGNFNSDPGFVGYPDLHLQNVSPCINTGTSSGAPSNDLDGNPRPSPVAGAFDMGAYEYQWP